MPISIPTSVAGISIPGAVNGPLNLLYGNKYNTSNFRFPRDVGSNPSRQHVILFTINEPDPNQTPQLGTAFVNIGEALPGAVSDFVDATVGGVVDAIGGNTTFNEASKKISESKNIDKLFECNFIISDYSSKLETNTDPIVLGLTIIGKFRDKLL